MDLCISLPVEGRQKGGMEPCGTSCKESRAKALGTEPPSVLELLQQTRMSVLNEQCHKRYHLLVA